MKHLGKVLMSISLIVSITYGGLITFDDLAWGPYDEEVVLPNKLHIIGDGYHGFNWDQFGICYGKQYELAGSGYENGIVSGEWVAFNLWSNVAIIEGEKPFNFESAYLTSAWLDNLTVNIKGLRNGIEIYDQTVIVTKAAPSFIEFNFKGIDQLVFISDVHFVIDNISYSYSDVTEPQTLLSFFMGLSGFLSIASFYRKKR